ncbi:hypothetical protein LEP1GSC158_0521 [Leptospira interrogans serovar Zanoni str. LT2156]|uniref:Uncharacterized protein n=1 Tax=Leptospira interrogans serovar Zanoni str. LT2156 TaxID=1001601 RepID=M6HF83_LEPIR|nr:hypothetical protein LEP1GSC158_0521 [Leptospira interrogans serovar Zanoni str. LT2156]
MLHQKLNTWLFKKPTDPPKDKPIKVIVSGEGKFCYGPDFSGGESYIIIEQCWQMHVMNARYDVFKEFRITSIIRGYVLLLQRK